MKLITLIFAVLMVGCSAYQRDIQICPQSCKPVVEYDDTGPFGSVSDALLAYEDRLEKQNLFYWLTDSVGRPVTVCDEIHGHVMFESAYRTNIITKEKPRRVREPFKLKGSTSDVVVHLIRPNGEESVVLRNAKLERHKDLDVLHVK